MDSSLIDPSASEPIATEQSSNMEDIEAFVEDNINVETTSDAELGDAADHDPEILPTEEEWNSMRRYGSFISMYIAYRLCMAQSTNLLSRTAHDDAGKQYTFQVNDMYVVNHILSGEILSTLLLGYTYYHQIEVQKIS